MFILFDNRLETSLRHPYHTRPTSSLLFDAKIYVGIGQGYISISVCSRIPQKTARNNPPRAARDDRDRIGEGALQWHLVLFDGLISGPLRRSSANTALVDPRTASAARVISDGSSSRADGLPICAVEKRRETVWRDRWLSMGPVATAGSLAARLARRRATQQLL